jgi:cysteine synthase A
MFLLAKLIGKRTGPSTGTNLWAAFELMAEMAAAGEQGSIVTLICDSGERYLQTNYNDVWMARASSRRAPGSLSFVTRTCSTRGKSPHSERSQGPQRVRP